MEYVSNLYEFIRSMFRNVVAALNEAQDITMYLKPLGPLFTVSLNRIMHTYIFLITMFQALEQTDFPDIIPQLRPLMHCICIVYSQSTYYNSPARIIVLMQETSNLLIDAARKYLDPSSLFQVEVEEALDKVLVTLKIFTKFRNAFREFKTKLPTYFKVGCL